MNGNNPPAFDPQAELLTHPQEIKFAQWLYKNTAGLEAGTAAIYRAVERDAVRYYLLSPSGAIPMFLDMEHYVSLTRQFFGYKVEPITLEQLEIKYLEEVARRIYAEWAYRQMPFD
jgi:hypothetical protein